MSLAPPGYREMSETDRRAVRRQVAAQITERLIPIISSDPLERLRADLEAFATGADALHGAPRNPVLLAQAFAQIDRRLKERT